MSRQVRTVTLFALVAALIVGVGIIQGPNSALVLVNMGLVSAVMALGVNLQWGYAGLFNIGIMGFVALGGVAAVIVSMPPVTEAWAAGGARLIAGLAIGFATIVGAIQLWKRMAKGGLRTLALIVWLVVGLVIFRMVFDGGVEAVEAVNPTTAGYLGGLNLPILLAWPAGGLLAAGVAWVIGKTALGLRSDYLAIATIGIAEIIIAVLKAEDWLVRGVKNVNGLPRPVPYEIDLQQSAAFAARAETFGFDPVTASTLWVQLRYGILFAAVLLILLWLAQRALNSPWGRMMRAIRDNEDAAEAMGKNVTARHLQIFVLGSAVCGIAGAMMTTLDGQLTPASYQPLRFTFLVWVMVILGGSGNNLGAVLGGFLVWFLWIEVEPLGHLLLGLVTAGMSDDSALKAHLLDSAAHMRLLTMGLVLLLVLRFSPRGLLPET